MTVEEKELGASVGVWLLGFLYPYPLSLNQMKDRAFDLTNQDAK